LSLLRSFVPNNLPRRVKMVYTSVLILGSTTCTLDRNRIKHNSLAKAQPFCSILWFLLGWCDLINTRLLCQHPSWIWWTELQRLTFIILSPNLMVISQCTKYASLHLILPDVKKNVRFPTTNSIVPSLIF
jgi:hypothetical protein